MDQNNKKKKNFHRHFATPGLNLYWIIIAYIIIGWFYPVIGLIALICMIGPVLTSIWRGRFWCGNVCPRGNLYDRLLSKYSPHKPIPAFVHTFGFRLFMVFFIFGMFGIQLTFTVPWSEGGLAMWSGIGRVFWTIIVVTTIVGITLSFIYAPRTWCSFCPMQLTPHDSRGQESGYLHPDCIKCGKCTLACPTKIMTLKH